MIPIITIFSFIELIHEFTTWIDDFSTQIIIVYFSLMVLLYLACVLKSYYDDYKQLLKVEKNRNGLLNQFNNDLKTKAELKNQLENKDLYISLMMAYLSDHDIENISMRLNLMKEVMNSAKRNESSKDNQQ